MIIPVSGSVSKALGDWLDAQGYPKTYRVEMVFEVGDIARMTVYRYAVNDKGERYMEERDGVKEVAKLDPITVPLTSWPPLPEFEGQA